MRGRNEQTFRWPYTLGRLPAYCLLTAAVVLMTAAGAGCAAYAAEGWRIDETHTAISFKVDIPGQTLSGRFTHFTGVVSVDFDRPEKSFTRFTVDAGSVDAGSDSFNNFMKGALLLNAAKFPALRFASTAVEKVDAHTVRVSGDLTMLGVTRPIVVTVNTETEQPASGRAVALQATGTIKRSEFGMTFGYPGIADAVEFTVHTRVLANE